MDKKQKDHMSTWQIYTRAMKVLLTDERALTITLLVSSLVIGLLQILEPVLFGRVIDSLSQPNEVFRILSIWGLMGATNIILSVFLAVMSDRLAHRQRLRILGQVFERVIVLPISYHAEQGSGRIAHSILTGTDQLFNLWLSFIRQHLSSIAGIFFLAPIALDIDHRMTGLLFLLAIIYLVANFNVVKRTYQKQEIVIQYHQNLFARIGDVIGNVNIVQSFTRLREEMADLQKLADQLLRAQYPILTWWGILSVITRISSTITMVLILSLGSWLVIHGRMTAGQVVAFVSFSGLLISRLEQISGFVSGTITQTPLLQSFFRLLDQDGAAPETPNARTIVPAYGEVSFNHVTYQFKNSDFGVFDLNFRAKPGQTVALVGLSGAGKSTALSLLQRLFDPQNGNITIDGEDIREFTLKSLRNSISTVFQEAGLFNRSISENIRVGRPDATDLEVEMAARDAAAHDFIMAKPKGYEFVIGERGAALSGGERQRIAIARAILKNSKILIFDEATSALDNQTEKKIQSALAKLRDQQKTTFVIAHRLSTVISADLILVFEQGRIVESGTFEDLRNQNGLFANLVKIGELTPNAPQGKTHELA